MIVFYFRTYYGFRCISFRGYVRYVRWTRIEGIQPEIQNRVEAKPRQRYVQRRRKVGQNPLYNKSMRFVTSRPKLLVFNLMNSGLFPKM
jgi:hypothetical protein